MRIVATIGDLLRRALPDQWRAIDAEHLPGRGTRVDWMPPIVFVTVAVSLTLQAYWGERSVFSRLFPRQDADWAGRYYDLAQFAWWAGWRVFGYLILPAVVIAAIPGQRVRDYYLGVGHLRRHAWAYVALLAAVAPLVAWASTRASFQHTYPFYKWANRSALDFWAWEALYAAQFISLEFFFRGFMLRGLERSMGSAAIFAMVVPYCMIHYGKPMPETLGAIVAGVVLGTLAMRTRSIWGGAALHIAVAVAMDLLAVGHCPPAASGLSCRPR
ncbi:MAG: CPBP family intramembrane metalloprotease [Deltaproteobacteria bacterium]|nr:MAG: CPBP family intramembrane metalloprotease [Deltaproteobacteria bacterium]